MSSPGWYPDPSGQPSSFRYWNGQVWSHETSQTPYVGPPPSAAPPPPPPPPMPTAPMPTQPPPGWAPAPAPAPAAPPPTSTGSGRKVLLILLAVLLVAGVAVGSFFGVRALTDDSDDGDATDDTSESASASASESEESESPSESPTESPSESPSETVEPSPTAIPSMCTTGAPQGGKAPGAVLRGGGLEAPRPDGFEPMGFDNAFVFADKVASVGRQVEPTWVAVYALGGLDTATGYTSLEQAAESVLSCMTESPAFYNDFSGRKDQGSSALTVDGHDAWRITAEVRVDDPTVSVKGDVATVIVVDTGAPRNYGLFVSVVPIGAPMLIGQQEQVAGSIRVP